MPSDPAERIKEERGDGTEVERFDVDTSITVVEAEEAEEEFRQIGPEDWKRRAREADDDEIEGSQGLEKTAAGIADLSIKWILNKVEGASDEAKELARDIGPLIKMFWAEGSHKQAVYEESTQTLRLIGYTGSFLPIFFDMAGGSGEGQVFDTMILVLVLVSAPELRSALEDMRSSQRYLDLQTVWPSLPEASGSGCRRCTGLYVRKSETSAYYIGMAVDIALRQQQHDRHSVNRHVNALRAKGERFEGRVLVNFGERSLMPIPRPVLHALESLIIASTGATRGPHQIQDNLFDGAPWSKRKALLSDGRTMVDPALEEVLVKLWGEVYALWRRAHDDASKGVVGKGYGNLPLKPYAILSSSKTTHPVNHLLKPYALKLNMTTDDVQRQLWSHKMSLDDGGELERVSVFPALAAEMAIKSIPQRAFNHRPSDHLLPAWGTRRRREAPGVMLDRDALREVDAATGVTAKGDDILTQELISLYRHNV